MPSFEEFEDDDDFDDVDRLWNAAMTALKLELWLRFGDVRGDPFPWRSSLCGWRPHRPELTEDEQLRIKLAASGARLVRLHERVLVADAMTWRDR